MLNVRSKVASKISKIKEADDFNFSNWLKKPLLHEHPVESLSSYVADLEDIQIEFVNANISQIKFDMGEPEVTDELKNCEFKKIRSNAIFFMIALPEDSGIVYSDVELKHKSFVNKNYEFVLNNPKIKNVKVNFDLAPPLNYDCQLPIPTIHNYLSDLVPEVFNIELLDFEDLVKSSKKVKVNNIGLDKFKKTKMEKVSLPTIAQPRKIFKIKVPSIGVFKFSQKEISLSEFTIPSVSETFEVNLPKVKSWFANFTIPKVNTLLYYRSTRVKRTAEEEAKPENKIVASNLYDQLDILLSNVRKVDWEKSGRHLTKLKPYEEVSTKFLVENDYALLQDEFGLDIQKETIAALKLLFANRVIKSALIITDETVIGNPKFANHLSIEIGWSDRIKKYSPELSLEVIHGNNDERADLWSKWKPVVIADIDTALNDYRLKILEKKTLEKFDCIILDSVDQLISRQENKEEFLSAIHPKIFWATSNVLDKNIHAELNSLVDSSVRIERLQIRSKQSVSESLPKFLLDEYWCNVDENQAAEFKTALTQSKKDLRRVLESGNPLRFYANIFTIFHKLNQIGNFASENSKSPKSELLLRHLKVIKENGKKALVLTQYENLGIKKISEVLNNFEIKHIVAPNSISADDFQKSIITFQAEDDIVALVTDSKISKLKNADFNLPYVIKFDQWWNPITNWELEDILLKGDKKLQVETLNLCNYYSGGILDQRIRELLIETDLLNKNVFELMQPKLYEELVLVDEWLKVFGMPVSTEVKDEKTPETIQTELKKITVDAFRKILSRLFTVLGYSNVDILELANSNSFNVIGKSQRNGREFFLNATVFEERKIDKKAIENIISDTSDSGKDKIFIMTRDSLPEVNPNMLRENVTLLDGLSLSKLLIRVGILPS